MKKMTPMAILSLHFKKVELLVHGMDNPTCLNKSGYKYNGFSEKGFNKGVKSDFIRIYDCRHFGKMMKSVAFVFNYIGLLHPTIEVTLMDHDSKSLECSREYSVPEFKGLMNQLISRLEEHEFCHGLAFLDETTKMFFGENSLAISKEEQEKIDAVSAEYQQEWDKKESILAAATEQLDSMKKKKELVLNGVNDHINASADAIELAQINEQLRALSERKAVLDAKITKEREKAQIKAGLPEIVKRINYLMKKKSETNHCFVVKGSNILSGVGKRTADEIKGRVEKK